MWGCGGGGGDVCECVCDCAARPQWVPIDSSPHWAVSQSPYFCLHDSNDIYTVGGLMRTENTASERETWGLFPGSHFNTMLYSGLLSGSRALRDLTAYSLPF